MSPKSIYEEYAALVEALWRANADNISEMAAQSLRFFPLPPVYSNLEIMSNNQFSKLLADTQKRAFYLGALAMAFSIEQVNQEVRQ